MQPGALACEAVIRVCESVESWQGALEALSLISESCVRPVCEDLMLWCLALTVCDKSSHWEWSLLLISDLAQRADDLLHNMQYLIVQLVENTIKTIS